MQHLQLPARSNIEHLKKQAKDLLRLYRNHDTAAIARIRNALPSAADKSDAAISALALRLHDAQSCVAREYGFQSWEDLRVYVHTQAVRGDDRAAHTLRWLRLAYAGEVAGGTSRAAPLVALRMLAEDPNLSKRDPYVACAIGDESVVRQFIADEPAWANRSGGPLNLPPLVAIAHSSLLRVPEFRARLHRTARLLLDAGADPNQSIGNRWPPASLSEPSSDSPLSALYGAAGQHHDPELTRMLLQGGANPDDGESLYHSLENIECTRLLLEAGARIGGTNAFYRVLDLDNLAALKLLLAHGADPNEPARNAPLSDFGSPLLWAIRRRRSAAHVEALLQAGADTSVRTPEGVTAYRLALRFGLADVAQLLRSGAAAEQASDDELFVAACASGDAQTAQRIRSARPDLPTALSQKQLRLLPDLASEGHADAVRLMVELGWPIAARGGDWDATALNLAVFRGDAALTRFLLEHGASWKEQHGFGDNTCGTLAWASCNEPMRSGDWLGCAEALVAHGMPGAQRDPDAPDCVLIDGQHKQFSEEVTEYLLGVRSG
jgi:ankyrin repeat protein